MKKLLKPLLILLTGSLLTSCAIAYRPQVGGNYTRINTSYSYSPDEGAVLLKAANTKAASSDEGTSGVVGPRIGLRVNAPFNDNLSFETGAFYSVKGNKLTYGSFEEKLKLAYFDIPVLARYQFNESGFNLYGGVQPSLLLNAKKKITIEGNETTQDFKENMNKFDIAGSLGIGYAFKNGLGIDVGYDHGFSNIYKSDYSTGKNRIWRLSVSYLLNK